MAGIGVAARAAGLLGGEAAAGGGMANVLGGLAGQFGDINKQATDASKSVGGLGDIFKQLQGGLGKLTPGFDGLLKQLPLLSASLAPLTAGFAGLQKGVEIFDEFVAVTSRLTNQFVAAYAPAEAELFTEALRDMHAVIGEQLVPVTRAARDAIRFVADALDGLTPLFRSLIESGLNAIRPAFESLGETFRRLMTVAQPTLQLFGEVFVELLGFVATQVEHVASAFNGLLESLRQFLGLPEFQMGNSRGKAASGVSSMSAQSFGSRLDQAAFRLGSESPEVKQLNMLAQVKQAILDLPGRIAAAIKGEYDKTPLGVAEAGAKQLGREWVDGAAELLRRMPRFDQAWAG